MNGRTEKRTHENGRICWVEGRRVDQVGEARETASHLARLQVVQGGFSRAGAFGGRVRIFRA